MRQVVEALNEVGGKSRASYSRSGLWPGIVEDVNDPRRLNRIRVRIYHVHGDPRATPISALPWAEFSDVGGGGYDYGSAGNLYPTGSSVWVMFVGGDDRFPVVVGGRRGSTQRDSDNNVEFLTVGGQSKDKVSTAWLPDEGNEQPKDVFDESAEGDLLPTRTVLHKSYKGHTILLEDRDGHEFLKIIDRAGQVIEMNCPVTESDNANNAQQRGVRNVCDDSQLPQSVLVNQRAFIRLKDVGGNEVILDGAEGNESITIRSKNRQGTSRQTLVLSSAKGREFIQLTDKQGNTFRLDPTNPAASLTMQDYTGNSIVFDAENGSVTTRANTTESHEAGSVSTTVGADRTETIGGSDQVTIAGNKIVSVLNDLSASIAAMSSLVFGGAIQASIANTPPTGVPSDTALSIDIALGGFLVSSQVNAAPMKVATLAGDVELSTIAGDLTVKTTLGSAELGTEAGQTTIKGSLGILLGSPATYSISYGEAIATAFTTVGSLAAADIRTCLGVPVPPTTLAGLPAALAPLIAPGVLYSLLNKTQ